MTWILAHRGSHGDLPENTLSSFKKAFEEGADGVELDVRPISDGTLVVFHDETLERMTGRKGRVTNLKLTELKSINVHGREKIPLLKEALNLIETYSKWALIDVKVPGFETRLIGEIGDYKKVVITSLHFSVSKKLKLLKPSLKTAILLLRGINYYGEDPIKLAITYLADYIHFGDPNLIKESTVERARKQGLKIIAGCSNDLNLLRKLVKMNLEFIMTDHPNILYKLNNKPLKY